MQLKTLVFAVLLAVAPPTFAGGGATGGSTEVTQMMNNTELLAQTAQQARLVQIQLQNALNDPNTPWGQTMTALQDLQKVYNTAQSIGYSLSSVQSQFNNLYQGYGHGGHMLDRLTAWGNQTKNSVNGMLSTAGWTMDQIATEATLIENLRVRGQTAVGQMQAIQVGNAVSVQMVQQLQQLRQLQAAQAQAMGSYLAAENQRAGDEDANLRALIPKHKPIEWGRYRR